MAKAFIFSIDAFVALTIVLVVLHSLIFIAAVPSSYYGGLMQASYLSRDTLAMLGSADASKVLDDKDFADMSLLDYLMSTKDPESVCAHVGALIPNQYGYSLEFWDSLSDSWLEIYSTNGTSLCRDEAHNSLYHKLRVSSYSIFFGYTDSGPRGRESPYCYITCSSSICPTQCDKPKSLYKEGKATLGLVRLSVFR